MRQLSHLKYNVTKQLFGFGLLTLITLSLIHCLPKRGEKIFDYSFKKVSAEKTKDNTKMHTVPRELIRVIKRVV